MAIKLSSVVSRTLVFMALIAAIAPAATAQPALTIDVEEVYGCRAGTRLYFDVRLDNPHDQIAGFVLWLQLDRPDIFLFDTYERIFYDSTYWYCVELDGEDCIDSTIVDPMQEWDWVVVDTVVSLAGEFDTTGTLLSGWDLVEARSVSGMGTDLKIVGLSQWPGGNGPPWMDPQEGGTLIRFSGEIQDFPPFVEDSTVHIMIPHATSSQFSFARPNGTLIAYVPVEIVDTNCFVCNVWEGEFCLDWSQVSMGDPEDCDSLEILTAMVWQLDTTDVVFSEDSITVEVVMGDFDGGSQPANPDIADLVYLVTYMFQDGPPLPCPNNTDCDGNDIGPDIADLVCWVVWMFQTF